MMLSRHKLVLSFKKSNIFSQKHENMVTRCLFGIIVFGSNSDLIYRFLTDDLFTYLYKCFIDRGYTFNEEQTVSRY